MGSEEDIIITRLKKLEFWIDGETIIFSARKFIRFVSYVFFQKNIKPVKSSRILTSKYCPCNLKAPSLPFIRHIAFPNRPDRTHEIIKMKRTHKIASSYFIRDTGSAVSRNTENKRHQLEVQMADVANHRPASPLLPPP